MIRRIPGREPIAVGAGSLRVRRAGPRPHPVAGPVRRPPRLVGSPAPAAGPAPLDEEWVEFLTARTQTARDRLVVRYLPLVRAIAHRAAADLPAHVEHDDLTQCGVFGLIDAVERFVPDRGPRFESFAGPRISGAIRDELRTQVVSVGARTGAGRVGDRSADHAFDPAWVVAARETLDQLHGAVAALGERDRRVVRLYYLENCTLAEIGRLLGVTESRVCQLHARLVGRLRAHLVAAGV